MAWGMIGNVAEQAYVVQVGELVLGCADGRDFDPDAVTSLVGITPTRFWRRGELRPGGYAAGPRSGSGRRPNKQNSTANQ